MDRPDRKVEDVVRGFGYLMLGSRLKRIGDRLQTDTRAVLAAFDAALPPGQFPVLAALDRLGPLSVGELAQALGVTQPGVTRLVARLEADGIVGSTRDPDDRRVRTVALTDAGRRIVAKTKDTAWPAVEAAVADACSGLSGPLLTQLAGLEDALKDAPLDRRAARSAPMAVPGGLERLPAHPSLDRPVWASLETHQAALSTGDDRARRYLPDVNMFAGTRDDGPAAAASLAALVGPKETVYLLQAAPITVPRDLTATLQAKAVQMVASGPVPKLSPSWPIVELNDGDVPDMLALTRLTEPGPFLSRTRTMGRFIGIRIDGRLAAMAGERMRLPGFTEVSGVCTHPDYRGRGLARELSAAVAAHIEARHETPFLHAWRDNAPAITLYEQLGFRIRREMNVAVLTR